MPLGRRRGSTRFFSGDWAHTGELLSSKGFGGHYDIILTSEGIYNQDSQWRLLECIKQVGGWWEGEEGRGREEERKGGKGILADVKTLKNVTTSQLVRRRIDILSSVGCERVRFRIP